jgi:hypothetical protein
MLGCKDHNDIHLLKFSGGFVASVSNCTKIACLSDDAYRWQGWAVLLHVELRLGGDGSNWIKKWGLFARNRRSVSLRLATSISRILAHSVASPYIQ